MLTQERSHGSSLDPRFVRLLDIFRGRLAGVLVGALALTGAFPHIAFAEDEEPPTAPIGVTPPPPGPETTAPPSLPPAPSTNEEPVAEIPPAHSEQPPEDATAEAEKKEDEKVAETPPPVPPPPAAVQDAPPRGTTMAAEKVYPDPEIPSYQRHRPSWGVELVTALKALGESSASPDGASKIRAIGLQWEYQPPFVQAAGVLGVGISLNAYPVIPATQLVRTRASIWSAGGQIRYQARYFREQPVVPYAGFAYEMWSYHQNTGPNGSFTATGPFFGAMLLMNFLDQSSAAEFYVNHGVTRSYLLAELRSLSGGDATLSYSGQALFFGLRIEY